MPHDMPKFAELSQFLIDPESVHLLPRRFCETAGVVVLGRVDPTDDSPVTIAFNSRSRLHLREQLEKSLGRPIEPVLLNVWEVEQALRRGFDSELPKGYLLDMRREYNSDNVPELIDGLLVEAVRLGASDIHIERYTNDVDLRYRVDGILRQRFTQMSPANVDAIVSRVKVIADLDIAEKRRPQDGRFTVMVVDGDKARPLDFRVSIVPAPHGEDVVMRLLDATNLVRDLPELGMPEDVRARFVRMTENPEGLILVTGPTGSGKTTTLYSAMAYLRDNTRKIITAEDPIEYDIPKINQKQVSAAMPLHSLLRALLRQDPDVILVGEVRDHPTGNTALMAAETGHVVLGTLHTADATSSVTRLRGLELENADIAAALLGVLAQRLVRRICLACRVEAGVTDEQEQEFGPLLAGITPMRGLGCDECHGTGYRGRTGIFELFEATAQIQEMIADGAHSSRLRRRARLNGMGTLLIDGMAKVRAGVTTLEEVKRVVPYRQFAQSELVVSTQGV